MTKNQIIEHLIYELLESGIPENQAIWIIGESDIKSFPQYLKLGHAPGHSELPIASPLDALLFYWKTEFQWCTDNPIWSSDYSELEYAFIQNLLNTFPQSEQYSTSLMLNFN